MAEWMIKRLIVQGREMESQIAARDRALFAGVDAQLEQHFMTPGQRLSPPGVGNVMLLMVCLTLGLAGVMGLVTDVAAAWSGKTSAAVLMGSGAIVAVWMTLILFQLVQGKNSGVVLLQYYLGMLGLCCLGAAAAWAAGMTGIATGALLLSIFPEILRNVVVPIQQALFGDVLVDPDAIRMLLFGIALVAVMIFRPEGLWPSQVRKRELNRGKEQKA